MSAGTPRSSRSCPHIDQENGYGFATIQAIQPFLKASDPLPLCGYLSLMKYPTDVRASCRYSAACVMFEITRSREHEQRSKDDQRKPEREKYFPEKSVHHQVREYINQRRELS